MVTNCVLLDAKICWQEAKVEIFHFPPRLETFKVGGGGREGSRKGSRICNEHFITDMLSYTKV